MMSMVKLASFIRKHCTSALIFSISKSCVFFGPLLLANILSKSNYGLLEACLAYSTLASIVVNFGISSTIPYYSMKERKLEKTSFVYLHSLIIFTVFTIISLILLFFHLLFFSLICLLIVYFSYQRIMSVEYTTQGNAVLASFSGTYVYFILLISAALSIWRTPISLNEIFYPLLIMAPTLAIWSLLKIKSLHQTGKFLISIPAAKKVYQYSSSTMSLGLILLGSTSFVRLIGLPLAGDEALAEYSFYFRVSSIPVVLYQFLAILVFREIYNPESTTRDKIITKLLLATFLIIILNFIITPNILKPYFIYLNDYSTLQKFDLLLMTSAYSLLWVSIAITEVMIYQQNIAFKVFMIDACILAISALACAALLLVPHLLNIYSLALIHVLSSATIAVIHCRVLAKSHLELPLFQRTNYILVSVIFLGLGIHAYFTL